MATGASDASASTPDAGGRPPHGARHEVELLDDMRAMIERVIEDIERATRRVLVETFIFRGDRLGTRLAEHLLRAKARGVDVRLLYDALGSHKTDPAFFDELRALGVGVRAYRPWPVVLRARSYFPRDHSRIILADERGYTGGPGWGDEWLPADERGGGWVDACVRLSGPCTEDLARIFELRWGEACDPSRRPTDYATGARYPDLEVVADAPGASELAQARHVDRIRTARRRVFIENSYFYPTSDFLEALTSAVRRGVDVKIILPRATDEHRLQWAVRGRYDDWLRRGLQLFEYAEAVLHSKFALIDDDWGTVGTFNVNPTSLVCVNELNVFVRDPTFVSELARRFLRDVAVSVRVTDGESARQPLFAKLRSLLAQGVLLGFESVRAPVHPNRHVAAE